MVVFSDTKTLQLPPPPPTGFCRTCKSPRLQTANYSSHPRWNEVCQDEGEGASDSVELELRVAEFLLVFPNTLSCFARGQKFTQFLVKSSNFLSFIFIYFFAICNSFKVTARFSQWPLTTTTTTPPNSQHLFSPGLSKPVLPPFSSPQQLIPPPSNPAARQRMSSEPYSFASIELSPAETSLSFLGTFFLWSA